MVNFAAIDFETANEHRTSICSVGVVVVRNAEITQTFYSLVRPEPEYYRYGNIMVHGITYEQTADSPVFPYVWRQIEPLIEGLPLVAHNKAFDENCLKACYRMYRMDYPDYEFHCTLQKPGSNSKACPITASAQSLHTAALYWTTTTTPWPTPKPAPTLPCTWHSHPPRSSPAPAHPPAAGIHPSDKLTTY